MGSRLAGPVTRNSLTNPTVGRGELPIVPQRPGEGRKPAAVRPDRGLATVECNSMLGP